jgi:hypothetical protein
VLIFQLLLRLAFATLPGMSNAPQRKSTAGAKTKMARNLRWLAEVEAGQATVRQIADRDFVTPGAVRKALKLARQGKASRES